MGKRLTSLCRKYCITREDVNQVKKLYAEGKSLRKIAKIFNLKKSERISNELIRHILVSQGIKIRKYSYGFEKCPRCGKKFMLKTHTQQFCNNPCNHKQHGKDKDKSLRWLYISSIRSAFYQLIKNNPAKALQLEKEMEREEGIDFKNMVLDGITGKEEFKELKEIQEKYKEVWEEHGSRA